MVSTRRTHAGAMLSMLALLAACASAPQEDDEPSPITLSSSRVQITAKELQSAGVGTTFDALRRLRPEFFLRRSTSTFTDPYNGYSVLYLDGHLQGSLDLLNTIPLTSILSIQYHTGTEAYARLGKYHPGGAINVKTHR
jgi:hypothetical protein